ncbi:hypothetical protein BKA65DRAFT_97243 [Rhexocercosporidium sp. MPI-PUGE-AT-0058]|nr:hypothetical protein BKA65DRAFT_97243 [Rhexocercosporidium sp. MPI-PUGE-AT-0058]
MAALLRGSSNPESSTRSSSRRRHYVHSRPSESRSSRRPQNEQQQQQQHYPMRTPPPRQIQWSAPSPMMTTTTTTTSTTNLNTSLSLEVANGITMERTPSGNSIMSSPPYEHQSSSNNTLTYRDSDAAHRVLHHFKRLPSHRKHERILRKLIRRDDPLDNSIIDDDALASIVNSTNAIFFSGVLSGRVQWEWSSQDRYHTELIGTTALRPRANGDGFETLIVLSEPILKDPRYDRRLLLSAFLHELIHCYLFILCGFEARRERGHTKGFHVIAGIIDGWVGEGYLSLCNMKANLNHFRKDRGMDLGREMGREMDVGRELDGLDLRVERRLGLGLGPGMSYPHVHMHGHGHEGCNQSPRPESGLVADLPDSRLGYF